MGQSVQVPASITGGLYRTLQKMARAIGECTVTYVRVEGSLGPLTNTTTNDTNYVLEDQIEVDTGYVPSREERQTSEWFGKVYNVKGTFSGTGTQVGFNVITMVSPNPTDTIKLLVQMYGKNLTDYTDFTADWVLHEMDR